MSFFDFFPTFIEAPWSYIMVFALLVSSVIGFYYKPYFHALLLHPYELYRGKRKHTLLTSAFVHRNWLHLLFNMVVIFGFGYDMFGNIEQTHGYIPAIAITPLIFVFCITVPNLVQTFVKKDNFLFTTIGASGLSSGLFGFSFVFFPLQDVEHLFLPFIKTSSHYWLYVLVILWLFSFIKQVKINRAVHMMGYLLGSLLALLIRRDSFWELVHSFGLY